MTDDGGMKIMVAAAAGHERRGNGITGQPIQMITVIETIAFAEKLIH